MMNCPTLPVASRNLGHPEEVRQNPKLSGIWAALIKDVPKWSPGSPPKRGNLLMLPPTDKAPLPSTGTNSNKKTISRLTATSHSGNQVHVPVNEINDF